MSTDKGKGTAAPSVADRIAEKNEETPYALYEIRWDDVEKGPLRGFTTSRLEYDICKAIQMDTLEPEYFPDEKQLQYAKTDRAQSYRMELWGIPGHDAGDMSYAEEASFWTLPDGTPGEDYDKDQRAVRTWGCKSNQ
jgi:hypothetical protein